MTTTTISVRAAVHHRYTDCANRQPHDTADVDDVPGGRPLDDYETPGDKRITCEVCRADLGLHAISAEKRPTTLGSILKHLGYPQSFIDDLRDGDDGLRDLDIESHCGKRCVEIAVRGIALCKAIAGYDEEDGTPCFDGESAEDMAIFDIVEQSMHVILFG